MNAILVVGQPTFTSWLARRSAETQAGIVMVKWW